jgi:hypothetical protein
MGEGRRLLPKRNRRVFGLSAWLRGVCASEMKRGGGCLA